MTATLLLTFDDGSTKAIKLANAVELDIGPEAKQSIEFRQTRADRWVMAFSKPLFEGKKIREINFRKDEV